MSYSPDRLNCPCWIDLFELPGFGGKMQRCFGPADLKTFSAASLIVGPGAHVDLWVRKNAKLVKLKFPPKRLEPDLAKRLGGETVQAAQLRESNTM